MEISRQLKPMIYSSLFVALISAGALLAIPLGPVPIVLQNMFVLLAGVILGPRWGVACVGIYLLIGGCGLPVFSSGRAGIGHLFGPTGGYLFGYLPCVFITGLIAHGQNKNMVINALAMVTGSTLIYATGVPWLKYITGMTWTRALAFGMYPFIPGDILKIAAALVIIKSMGPYLKLSVEEKTESKLL